MVRADSLVDDRLYSSAGDRGFQVVILHIKCTKLKLMFLCRRESCNFCVSNYLEIDIVLFKKFQGIKFDR